MLRLPLVKRGRGVRRFSEGAAALVSALGAGTAETLGAGSEACSCSAPVAGGGAAAIDGAALLVLASGACARMRTATDARPSTTPIMAAATIGRRDRRDFREEGASWSGALVTNGESLRGGAGSEGCATGAGARATSPSSEMRGKALALGIAGNVAMSSGLGAGGPLGAVGGTLGRARGMLSEWGTSPWRTTTA